MSKKKAAEERLELTVAQQHTALALLVQRERVIFEANKALAEIAAALEDLAETYARKAGLDGKWEFGQDVPNQLPLHLQRVQENNGNAE